VASKTAVVHHNKNWALIVADGSFTSGGNASRPTLSVRSTPNSERKRKGLGLCRKVPGTDSCSAASAALLDQFVGADEDRWAHRDAKRFRSFHIDH
jgi:hypothetical protein